MTARPSSAEKLESALQQLLETRYTPELLETVREHERVWLSELDTTPFLQAAYVCTEVYDYYDSRDALRDVLDLATERAEETASCAEPGNLALPWALLVLIGRAQAEYRAGVYTRAVSIVSRCDDVLHGFDSDASIARADAQLLLIRARLEYVRGKILRQQSRYVPAREAFSRSMRLASLYLTELRDESPDSARLQATWMMGKALTIGLGWIAYIRGQLSDALQLTHAGAALLRQSGDQIHMLNAQLLLGAMERSLADVNDTPTLRRAQARIREAFLAFSQQNHRYVTRAAYELALACSSVGDVDEARSLSEWVRDNAGTDSARWRSHALTLLSRLDRREMKLHSAITNADEAVDCARDADIDICEIEALIARGEASAELALLESGDGRDRHIARAHKAWRAVIDARAHLENPKWAAVTRLHLARMYTRLGDRPAAREHYEEAMRIAGPVESGFVRALTQEVARYIGRAQFVIDGEERDLRYEVLNTRLKHFLIDVVRMRASTEVERARLLGISTPTLRSWMSSTAKTKKRGRPRTT